MERPTHLLDEYDVLFNRLSALIYSVDATLVFKSNELHEACSLLYFYQQARRFAVRWQGAEDAVIATSSERESDEFIAAVDRFEAASDTLGIVRVSLKAASRRVLAYVRPVSTQRRPWPVRSLITWIQHHHARHVKNVVK